MKTKQKHIYDYEINITADSAPAHVVRMVGPNKRVLEVGCGPGSITRILARQSGCKVTGLELDQTAIKIVGPYCENVIEADLNSSDWPCLLEGKGKFDVVVAADVLEHLYDPWKALQRMKLFVNEDGYLVISMPHVGNAAIMACMINGDFSYRNFGLLDRTHIRFFGLKNIEALFAQAGLKIIDVRYVIKHPEESEFADSWSKLSLLLRVALMRCKHAEVYQVVVKAVPAHCLGKALSLVPPRRRPLFGYLNRRYGRYLSPQVKQLIRKGLSLMRIKI